MTTYKQTLPETTKIVLTEEIQNLPVCQTGESIENNQIPTCIPQGTNADQIVAQITPEDYQHLVNEVPDTIQFTDLVKNPDQTFARAKISFQILRWGLILTIILSIIFLGILALMGLGYWPSILRWFGVALVIPAGANLLAVGLWQLLHLTIQNQILSGFNPQALPYVTPIIETLNNNFLKPATVFSSVIFILGLIMIILSYALSHPPEPRPPAKVPAAPTSPQPKPQ